MCDGVSIALVLKKRKRIKNLMEVEIYILLLSAKSYYKICKVHSHGFKQSLMDGVI